MITRIRALLHGSARSPEELVSLAILLVFVVVNLSSLAHYPIPLCDETNHMVISYQFFREGRFAVNHMGDMAEFSSNVVPQGRLYQVSKGVLLELLGYSLFVGRLYSTIGWLLGILFVYLLGRKLVDLRVGIVAALLFGISNNTFYASHVGREEIWVVAAGAGLLYYHLLTREKPTRLRYAFLGLLAALALDIHPNAIWYSLPLGLWVVWDNFRSGEGRRQIAVFALAGVLGTVAVILMHILPDPEVAINQMRFAYNRNELWTSSLLRQLRGQWVLMRNFYLNSLNGSVIPMTALYLAGIGHALARRSAADKLLLSLWGGTTLLFTLTMSYKNPFYGIIWEPVLALMAAGAVVNLAGHLSRRWPAIQASAAALLLISPLISVNLASQAWLSYKFSPRDFRQYQSDILAHIPPGVHVLGEPALWLAFNGRNPFTSDHYLDICHVNEICPTFDDETLAAILTGLAIDYVVDGGDLGCALTTNRKSMQFSVFLESHCRVVGQVDNRWFGANGQIGQGQPTIIYDCRDLQERPVARDYTHTPVTAQRAAPATPR